VTACLPPGALEVSRTTLALHWHDRTLALPAALLRARCRCADCVAAARRGAPPPPAAALLDAIPVGHYAVQLRFSDGHERGIYPWDYLRGLGETPAREGSGLQA
jgi:DUF971 family protein